MLYDWKKKPISLAINSKMNADLIEAGFKTVGDLVDADPADIAAKVKHCGLKRAEKIRSAALADALSDALDNQTPPVFVELQQEPFSYVKLGLTILATVAIVFAVNYLISVIA
jgi:hypothetical protein